MRRRDVWGRVLADFARGLPARYVVRRDDGQVDDDSPEYYFAPPEDWLPCERAALAAVRGPVLDLGCGVGRVALVLQRTGIEVVAVDRSPGAVRLARERGVRDARLGDVSARSLPRGRFATALLLGNNLGIAGSLKATESLLGELRRRLGPEGAVVFSTCDPLAAGAPKPAGGRRRRRYIGEFRLRIEYEGQVGPWFGLVLFDRLTLERLARRTGWRVAEIYDCAPLGPGFYAGVLRAATRPAPPSSQLAARSAPRGGAPRPTR